MAISPNKPQTLDPVDQGSHQAVIVSLIDLGHQDGNDYKTGEPNVKHQLFVGFQLPHEKDDRDRPRYLSRIYTLSLNSRAGLRKLVEAAYGRSLTDDEAFDAMQDPRNLIGRNLSVSVVHKTKEDKKFSQVDSVAALMKGIPHQSPVGDTIVWEIESPDLPQEAPDWVKRIIVKAHERTGGVRGPKQPDQAKQSDKAPTVDENANHRAAVENPPPAPPAQAKSFDEFDPNVKDDESEQEKPEEKPKPKRKAKAKAS